MAENAIVILNLLMAPLAVVVAEVTITVEPWHPVELTLQKVRLTTTRYCAVQFWMAPFNAFDADRDERAKRRNWFARRPAVHHGFQRSWTANGLNRRIVDRVGEIAEAAATQGNQLQLFTTGAEFRYCAVSGRQLSVSGTKALLSALQASMALAHTSLSTVGAAS